MGRSGWLSYHSGWCSGCLYDELESLDRWRDGDVARDLDHVMKRDLLATEELCPSCASLMMVVSLSSFKRALSQD